MVYTNQFRIEQKLHYPPPLLNNLLLLSPLDRKKLDSYPPPFDTIWIFIIPQSLHSGSFYNHQPNQWIGSDLAKATINQCIGSYTIYFHPEFCQLWNWKCYVMWSCTSTSGFAEDVGNIFLMFSLSQLPTSSQHVFWHSFQQPLASCFIFTWHPLLTSYLTVDLTSYLTYYPYCLTSILTSDIFFDIISCQHLSLSVTKLLTFDLTCLLASLLIFYLAYVLTPFFTSDLTCLLTSYLKFHLSYIPSGIESNICSGITSDVLSDIKSEKTSDVKSDISWQSVSHLVKQSIIPALLLTSYLTWPSDMTTGIWNLRLCRRQRRGRRRERSRSSLIPPGEMGKTGKSNASIYQMLMNATSFSASPVWLANAQFFKPSYNL